MLLQAQRNRISRRKESTPLTSWRKSKFRKNEVNVMSGEKQQQKIRSVLDRQRHLKSIEMAVLSLTCNLAVYCVAGCDSTGAPACGRSTFGVPTSEKYSLAWGRGCGRMVSHGLCQQKQLGSGAEGHQGWWGRNGAGVLL